MTGADPRPPASDLALLAVGVLGVAASGPIVVATAAPALAIAFWRNALGAGATAPVALLRHRGLLRTTAREQPRVLRQAGLAGVLLALHFACWIPSLGLTSVASSVALVATQPVWTAIIERARGHAVPARTWLGIGVALVGVLLVVGIDVRLDARALAGDALALTGAVFAAGYVTVGAEVRRVLPTSSYTLVAYSVAAVVLLALCLLFRAPLIGYPPSAWAGILALTVLAQLLGHTVFNTVLRSVSPTVLSLAILLEVPGAALIAAVFLGQTPPPLALPALLLLLAGLALVMTSQGRSGPPAVPAE